MSSFSDLTVRQFIDELASAAPTPGGGSAAAIVGALGTALLVMVSGLPKSRHGTDEDTAALAAARTALSPLLEAFQSAADRDTAAFDRVIAAFRLPKSTDDEKAARKVRVQEAYREATEVPLQTLRLAAGAIAEAAAVGRHGVSSASSDVGVAAGLLQAAAEGAAANVRINLGSLTDEAFRERAEAETADLLARAAADAAKARAVVP